MSLQYFEVFKLNIPTQTQLEIDICYYLFTWLDRVFKFFYFFYSFKLVFFIFLNYFDY
jgi:hypothetical protein